MRFKVTGTYTEMATDEFLVEADSAADAKEVIAGDDSKGEVLDVKNVWVGDRAYFDDVEVETVTTPYEDQNWDTLETERWIDNDINMCSLRHVDEETLRAFVGLAIPCGLDVAVSEVDFDYLVESFNE